jgi:predicted DNA-binding transcriptional regulator AlpA
MSLTATNPAAHSGTDDDMLLRVPEVLLRLKVSESTFRRMIRAGRFPKPVHPSPNVTAWRASDVRDYFEGLGTGSVR